jgi:hypothetical protein
MKNAVFLIKPKNKGSQERGIVPLVQKKEAVRHVVGKLKESTFLRGNEVRNVAQIVKNAPLRAQISEALHPDLRSGLVTALCEHQQPALRVIEFRPASGQHDVEALADLFHREFHGVIAMERRVLFDDGPQRAARRPPSWRSPGPDPRERHLVSVDRRSAKNRGGSGSARGGNLKAGQLESVVA